MQKIYLSNTLLDNPAEFVHFCILNKPNFKTSVSTYIPYLLLLMVNDLNYNTSINPTYAIIARAVYRQVVITFSFYVVLTGVLLY